MIELYKLDSDVLVGHNISGFDLDALLHRAQVGILLLCFLLKLILPTHIMYFSMHSKQDKQGESRETIILIFVIDKIILCCNYLHLETN